MSIAILVTTYNRRSALERSLPQIAALGVPVLVVDDGTPCTVETSDHDLLCENQLECDTFNVQYLRLPSNRGLACALNVGLSYWLADKSIDWISYFQDDVDVNSRTLDVLAEFHNYPTQRIMTGHDAGEHAAYAEQIHLGRLIKFKRVIRATHVHAHRDFWLSVMPFPTRELGAPKRQGLGRGLGSNVDWWFCRDAPNSCQKTDQPILCVPGLVRSFLWKGEDSCWNNTQKSGEEPALTL